jgi:hypothetical protein
VNFFSAFTTEVFRPLVTLLVPGAVALSTWVVFITWRFPLVKDLMAEHSTESAVVLTLAVTFAGMVTEDFGSRIESWMDSAYDRYATPKNDHTRVWYDYLRCAFNADPIGRRYVRTLVLRLKFELGTACALAIAWIGLFWLADVGLTPTTFYKLKWILLAGALWELFEAYGTHKVLRNLRIELLKPITIIG